MKSPDLLISHKHPIDALPKKLHIILAFACLWAISLPAQVEVKDQLNQVRQYLDAAEYARADSLLLLVYPKVKTTGDPELEARALHLAGHLHLEQGELGKAQQTFSRALQASGESLPADHPALAQAHNDLGHYFFTVRQLDSAWQHHQIALSIRRQNFGEIHPKVADSYNNLGNIWQLAGQPGQALTLYQQALNIRRQYEQEEPLDFAAALNNLGNAYRSLGRLAEATAALRKSMQIRQQLLGREHPAIGKTLQNLGIAFLENGQLDSAEYYDLAALDNARLNFEEGHPQFANLYENLGNCYLQQAELEEAEKWYRQAVSIREAHTTVDSISPAFSYLHMGDLFRRKGDYLEALQWTEQGSQLLNRYLPPGDPAIADALEKMGLCHLALGHIFEADRAFTDVRDMRWQLYGSAHPQIAGVLTNLGNVYWEDDDFGAAIYYYQDALSVWEQLSGDHDLQRAKLYSNIGNSYLKEKNWQPALEAYQDALQLLGGSSFDLQAEIWQQMAVAYDGAQQYDRALQACDTAFQLLEEASGELSSKRLLVMNARANILLHQYQEHKEENTLYLAEKAYRQCLTFLDKLQETLLHAESRQQTMSLHYDLFSGAIECDLELWVLKQDSAHLWSAFRLSEVSKSMRLRTEDANGKPGKTSSFSDLAQSLQIQESAAWKLQDHLQGDRGLLTFFAGPERLFWFLLHNGNLQTGVIADIPQINELTSVLGRSITAYPFAASAEKPVWDSIYRESALALYQMVWKPMAVHFSGISELIIVPDGALAYLPFPTLLTAAPANAMRYRSYPFLLHDYQISYAYSASWLANALARPSPAKNLNCLALAPTFANYEPKLDSLEFSSTEVNALEELLGAQVLMGKEADLATFWQLASQYNILHLATHGIDNIYRGDYSYLAFTKADAATEGRLFVEDLFRNELHADLVVMSACESGVGRYQEGEGVISLARGFVAAGAKSVVSTFWSVNDAKSVDFMLEFYRQLKNGATKDSALRYVQRQYISGATQEDAHPFYWAAYFPVGNMAAVPLSRSLSWFWLLGSLLVLILLAIWYRRQRKRMA